MARIDYFDITKATPDMQRAFDMFAHKGKSNLYRMLAHGDAMANGAMAFIASALKNSKLDQSLREIVTLRTAHLGLGQFIIAAHEAHAREIGMAAEKIAAIKTNPDSPLFSPLERAAMKFTDEVVKDVRASDATFNELKKHLGPDKMMEVMLVINVYMMISRITRTFDVDLNSAKH